MYNLVVGITKDYVTRWRRSEAAVTRRTRNAFVGSSRHEGSNPSVSGLKKPLEMLAFTDKSGIFKGFFILLHLH